MSKKKESKVCGSNVVCKINTAGYYYQNIYLDNLLKLIVDHLGIKFEWETGTEGHYIIKEKK